MLLDDVKDLPSSGWGRYLRKEIVKEWKKDALRARPYVFDRAASYKLGQFIRDCPDIIADHLEFARPPFPVTYIELEIDAVHAGIGSLVTKSGPEADWKLGILINEENAIKTLCRNRAHPDMVAGLFGYMDMANVSGPVPKDDEEETRQIVLWGSSVNQLREEQRKKLTDAFVIEALCENDDRLRLQNVIQGSVGELRVIMAALLLLQQKRCISIGPKAWERKIARGKSRVFMAHSVVTIALDGPVEMRRSFSITDRASPRAHEVPAHYCHRHGDRGCEHVWVKREDEENHWDCPKCGRFRYLRRHHMRGDASKGFVTREYEVTTAN